MWREKSVNLESLKWWYACAVRSYHNCPFRKATLNIVLHPYLPARWDQQSCLFYWGRPLSTQETPSRLRVPHERRQQLANRGNTATFMAVVCARMSTDKSCFWQRVSESLWLSLDASSFLDICPGLRKSTSVGVLKCRTCWRPPPPSGCSQSCWHVKVYLRPTLLWR